MNAVEFKKQNVIFAKDQPQYNPLPAHRTPTGEVTTCWEMDEEEKAEFEKTGKIYIRLLTFNGPLQPMAVSANVNHLIETTPADTAKNEEE